MSGFREFKYSVITLICAVLLNVFIISILYWIFNVRKFPPVFSRDSLNNTSIVLTVITILITRFLIAHYDISLKQKNLTTLWTNSCVFLTLLIYQNILTNYGLKTQKINNIEEIYQVKNIGVAIQDFQIINHPIIDRQVKFHKSSSKKTLQIIFLYPFKSKKDSVYYALEFESYSDYKTDKNKIDSEFKNLIRNAKNNLQFYNFKKVKNFEYITRISYEYNDFLSAVGKKSKNIIFLKPIEKKVEEKAKDEIQESLIIILMILFIHVLILLFTRFKKESYNYS